MKKKIQANASMKVKLAEQEAAKKVAQARKQAQA